MMTHREPDLRPNDRLNGAATARALGIARETLRQYVIRGYIRPKYGRGSTRPYYLGSDILNVWRNHY